jgi:hypothetical protein
MTRTIPSTWIRPLLWLIGLLLVVAVTSLAWTSKKQNAQAMTLVLLLPDEQARTHPVTQAWLDAAHEEGVPLQPMTDDEFIRQQANRRPMAGVILPDTVHPHASDLLINTLYHYVETGGRLLVGFDAALLKLHHPHYASQASRLSGLVGVRYAMYQELGDDTLNSSAVLVSREGEQRLGIQPGKLDFSDDLPDRWGELTTYAYEALVYDHFRTAVADPTDALLVSERPHVALGADAQKLRTWIRSKEGDTILAVHQHGQGQVMFANLPLGYLKTRTDSYLLHRVVHHFGTDMAQLPSLAATPQGIGGMVLNLHVDSNSAQKPLGALERSGWFDDGPYSIHVTAGPDAHHEGDRLGLNVNHNPWMRAFLRRQHQRGHEVGSHGGWTHNVFGYQANEYNQDRFEPYLAMNHQSVWDATGHEPQVYSAPMGNQPHWATAWLHARGFKAFYTSADTGLGATRSYIQGKPSPYKGLWNFPISNFKRIATVDELEEFGMQEREIRDFIVDLFAHVSEHHLVRLFYFHPATTPQYFKTMRALREQAQLLQQKKTFRWYRMAELSDFMNRRAEVTWQVRDQQGERHLQASSPASLEDITWLVPARSAKNLRITQGQGRIERQEHHWLVSAGAGQSLSVAWTHQSPRDGP